MKAISLLLRVIILVSFMANISVAQGGAASDRYWISFVHAIANDNVKSGGPKYLMQIDVLGNILIRPQKVIATRQVRSDHQAPTAIAHSGPNQISMWSIDNDKDRRVVRARIDKRTLSLISLRTTSISTDENQHLQVTQRDSNNFLVSQVFQVEGAIPSAFGLSPTGAATGKTWNISVNPEIFDCFDDSFCGPGVSSDGRMAILAYKTDKTRVLLQPLTTLGKPKGAAIEIFSAGRRSEVRSPDITNILSGQRRFAVYMQFTLRVDAPAKEVLYLQVVDAKSGNPLGTRIPLANVFAFGQSVAIDPLGRFVIYEVLTPAAELALTYQALDAIGHPSGGPKIIATRVESGLDILKD